MSGVPSRRCKACGKRIHRRKAESNYAFARRQFCSMLCEMSAYPNSVRFPGRELWERAREGLR